MSQKLGNLLILKKKQVREPMSEGSLLATSPTSKAYARHVPRPKRLGNQQHPPLKGEKKKNKDVLS